MGSDAKRLRSLSVEAARQRQATSQMRPCLRCDHPFTSWGVENRLCNACRNAVNHMPSDVRPQRPRGLRRIVGESL